MVGVAALCSAIPCVAKPFPLLFDVVLLKQHKRVFKRFGACVASQVRTEISGNRFQRSTIELMPQKGMKHSAIAAANSHVSVLIGQRDGQCDSGKGRPCGFPNTFTYSSLRSISCGVV